VEGILGGAYARVLEGGLLVVGRRHEGDSKGVKWRHGGMRERDHIADRPGTKKGTGPKKLIFDFSKGILHRAMIKFEADPVLGYK
jgi:hypothetical protein